MTFSPELWAWWSALAVALASGLIGPAHPASLATSAAAFVWGVTGHPTQQATYSSMPGLEAQLDYLEQLGASHYRLDLSVDTFGVVDSFHSGRSVSFERVLTAAGARHLQLLPVLTQRPNYRATVAENQRVAYLIGLRFAEQYGARLQHIEAGNEIEDGALRYNLEVDPHTGLADTSYWVGTEADHYAPDRLEIAAGFLRGMIRGIREGAPHLQVIVNVAGRHYGFFEALQRNGVEFDIYGLHWYSDMHQQEKGLAQVVDALDRLPRGDLPIWVTEANRRGGSDGERPGDDQGNWIRRLAAEISARPRVQGFFVYELLDQPAVASSYGLVSCPSEEIDPYCQEGRTPKPAFDQYRSVILEHRLRTRSRASGWPPAGEQP